MVMFEFGRPRETGTTFTFEGGYDPDRPLPSIESQAASINSREGSLSNEPCTPASSTPSFSPQKDASEEDTLRQIYSIRNLRLSSQSQRSGDFIESARTPTPSINVTPSASPERMPSEQGVRSDSLVGQLSALDMGTPNGYRCSTPRLRSSRPSSQSRRRSGSAIAKDSHRVEDEEPPDTLMYKPEVQDAFSKAKECASGLASVLSSSKLHHERGSKIEGLHRTAVGLSKFQLPVSQVVGLVGDSGVGKSSLINSLLDKADLARASSSGTACTCAVTEYVFHGRADFVIEVEYFPREDLKHQFEELLRAYRDFHEPSQIPNAASDRGDGGDGAASAKELQKKANLAIETFQACFGQKISPNSTLLASKPFDRAIRTMLEWSDQMLSFRHDKESYDDIGSCSARLASLSSEVKDHSINSPSCIPWPFIQKLRVYLNAHILRQGLIIADLPGLRDLNSARKAITERHVRKCHQVFVVARIDRAVTDESIKDIFELAFQANLTKLDVICTRAEDIQPREAKRDWPHERFKLDDMQTQINEFNEEISLLKEDIEEYDRSSGDLSREEQQQLSRLERDYRKISAAKEAAEFKLKTHVMGLRNDKVSRGLRDAYHEHAIASTLRIFCVSNTMYWDNREKSNKVASDRLSRSGIIGLRQYCIGIVADSRLRSMKSFIKDDLPAFLASVELWIEAGSGDTSAEMKQQVLDALHSMELGIKGLISPASPSNILFTSLEVKFDGIYRAMRGRDLDWSNAAQRASEDWRGWHHSSYKAFCSNYGNHSTPKMGRRCWNAEVMRCVNEDMTVAWNLLELKIQEDIDHAKNEIVKAYHEARAIALAVHAGKSTSPSNHSVAMKALASALHHQKDSMMYAMDCLFDGFVDGELAKLRTDSLSSIRTAVIGQLMETSYHSANMEYGSGSDQRRKNIISDSFGSRTLFATYRRNCKDTFRNISRALQSEVRDLVHNKVESVLSDLRTLQDEHVVLESERNPEFRIRLKSEVQRCISEIETLSRVFCTTS